jgi:hypothetical protein
VEARADPQELPLVAHFMRMSHDDVQQWALENAQFIKSMAASLVNQARDRPVEEDALKPDDP